MSTAVKFKAVVTPSGKRAYEAHIAIWRDGAGEEIIIGAPTLEILEEVWERETGTKLNPELAQFVWIVKASQGPDVEALLTKPAAGNASCSLCSKPASFIISKRAYCEDHYYGR